jgi:hypothetical protein
MATPRTLRIKNWSEFQHYRDRNPPWIKLHRALLDDYDFAQLPDATKAHLMLMWLFASQNGGKIPEDAKFLQRKLGFEKPPDLESLINQGLLIPEQDASNTLADCKQDASDALALARSREKRREEAEESTRRFAELWQRYPRKVNKQEAEKAFRKLNPDASVFERMITALGVACASDQWQRDNGRFIPHAATWINNRRFEDAVESPAERPLRVAL